MTAALIGRFAEPVLTFPLQAPQSSTDKPCGLAGATTPYAGSSSLDLTTRHAGLS